MFPTGPHRLSGAHSGGPYTGSDFPCYLLQLWEIGDLKEGLELQGGKVPGASRQQLFASWSIIF